MLSPNPSFQHISANLLIWRLSLRCGRFSKKVQLGLNPVKRRRTIPRKHGDLNMVSDLGGMVGGVNVGTEVYG